MPKNIKATQHNAWRRVITALAYFLTITILFALLLVVFYRKEVKPVQDNLKRQAVNTVTLQKNKIGGNFGLISADLLFLANHPHLKEMFTSPGIHRKNFAGDLALFSRTSKIYDQVRVLDSTGMELIRVNLINGKAVVVPDDQLQFKGDRYYFKETISLGEGEVFISPLDLNMEHGRIEQPPKPMLRFGTPVFDAKGRKLGVIVFNYLAGNLIQNLKAVSAGHPGQQMLLNQEGYWLSGGKAGDEWGFMYENGKQKTMANKYPEAWQTISNSDSGQFVTRSGLFAFSTVYPLTVVAEHADTSTEAAASEGNNVKPKGYGWKIVSFIPNAILYAGERSIRNKYGSFLMVLLILSAAGSWFAAESEFARRQREQDLLSYGEKLKNEVRERTGELEKSSIALLNELDAHNQTENELREQVDFNRRVFNSTNSHLAVVAKDGFILEVNDAWRSFAKENLSDDESAWGVGANYFVKYDENWGDAELAAEAFDGVRKVQSGQLSSFSLEYPCHGPGDVKRWFLLYVSPLQGKAGSVLASHTNITVRKLAEVKVQQSLIEMTALNVLARQISANSSLDNIVDAAFYEISRLIHPDLVLLFMRNGENLELLRSGPKNSSLKHGETPSHHIGDCLCGLAASSGQPTYSINIHADSRCSWNECKKAGVRSFAALPLLVENQVFGVLGLASDVEVDFEKQGSFLEVLATEIALGVKNALLIEEVMKHSGALENEITERKQAEEELRLHKEHLEELVEMRTGELAAANVRLQEVDRLKSMFIASMSHELRTPLNSVIGFSSRMLKEWIGALNDEQKKSTTSILNSGKHLLSLINDVIDVSKIEAGMIEVGRDSFDLAELLTEVEQAFSKEAQDRRLFLKVQQIHLPMLTDRRRLLQCLFNLVSNAIKYSEQGGVSVAVQHDQVHGRVTIAVTDTGIGIALEDQSTLFQAFSRLQSPLTAKVLGTGLGLYLTKKITVEMLQGEISMRSEPGKGSTFTMTLPCRV